MNHLSDDRPSMAGQGFLRSFTGAIRCEAISANPAMLIPPQSRPPFQQRRELAGIERGQKKADINNIYEVKLSLQWVLVREQETAKSQHYHLIMMLDGDKIRHPARLSGELGEIWGRKGGGLWMPPNPFIFIDKPELVAEAVTRASYLAKGRGKGYRPDGARDFGCSRINPVSPTVFNAAP